jgi:hypothetical protein
MRSITGRLCLGQHSAVFEDLECICTQECSDSLASTRKSIASGCAKDNIIYVYDNREYPMTRPIDKMIDTKKRTCLRDT